MNASERDNEASLENEQRAAGAAESQIENFPHAGTALEVAREMIYSPLDSENLTEQATRRIAEAIGLGLLEVGERLPSEAELANRFGVAPMTVRESLNVLRRAGYLDTRRGRGGGTFIRRAMPQPRPGSEVHELGALEVDEIRDLTELRVAVSGAAAGLAAERARDEELGELRKLVEAMASEDRHSAFRRLDTHFHVAVASASRSRRLTQLESSIQSELQAIFPTVPTPTESLGIMNGQHRAIVSALVERDPEEARRATEEHARATGEYLVLLRMGTRT